MPQNRSQAVQSRSRPVIVLTGGGSGGHITPLLSLARALKRKSTTCRVIYIGLKGEKATGLSKRYDVFDAAYFISAGKFRRYHGQNFLARLLDIKTFLLNVRDFFRLFAGTMSSRRLIRKLKPDVVFSKGGFVAVPVGIAAKMKNIPIVTHDSDTAPGLANRILGRWAKVRTTGMPAGEGEEKFGYIGIPVDERIKEVTLDLQKDYRRLIGAGTNDKVLLIGGAGLGSRDINHLVVEALPKLFELVPTLRVFHFTGDAHKTETESKYSQSLSAGALERVKIIGFSDDFYKYTGAADLVVTRAGATTIAELAIQKKAVLLMPAAFLAGGHQLKNARILASIDAVEVADTSLKPEKFARLVTELLQNTDKQRVLGRKLGSLAKPNAAENLARILLEVAQEGQKR